MAMVAEGGEPFAAVCLALRMVSEFQKLGLLMVAAVGRQTAAHLTSKNCMYLSCSVALSFCQTVDKALPLLQQC